MCQPLFVEMHTVSRSIKAIAPVVAEKQQKIWSTMCVVRQPAGQIKLQGFVVLSGRLCLSSLSSLDPYRLSSDENVVLFYVSFFFTEKACCEKLVTVTFEGVLLQLCDDLHILLKKRKYLFCRLTFW